MIEIKCVSDTTETYYSDMKSNQGKRVGRDHEDVWDKCIGRTKNHLQVRWSTVVRA